MKQWLAVVHTFFFARFLVILLGSLTFQSVASAQPFQPDSVLVSSGGQLFELSPAGQLLQQMPIPQPYGEASRDLIVSESGEVAIYNGTFNPVLTLYDPQTQSWREFTAAGWSTANNTSYGGITSVNGEIIVTDMLSDGDGLIRFQSDGSFVRHMPGNEYIDVTLGLDGQLYALRNMYGHLEILNPANMMLVNSLALDYGIRGVTADANGNLYAVNWNGDLLKYDANGQLLDVRYTGFNTLSDIDISPQGQLLACDAYQNILFADLNLNITNQFSVPYSIGYANTFVAFASGLSGPPVELTESSKLYDPSGTSYAYYGESVDIHQDRMIVGAPNGDNYYGVAYIYERVNGSWQEKRRLSDMPAQQYTRFGSSVAIHGDFAAVSNPDKTVAGINYIGSVTIYRRTPNGDWQAVQEVYPTDTLNSVQFGRQIALTENRLVVTAPYDYMFNNYGTIYVYRKDSADQWQFEAKLLPDSVNNINGFGERLAVTDNLIATSAQEYYPGNATHIYSYRLEQSGGDENWYLEPKLALPPELLDPAAGYAPYIDLAANDNHLVAGVELKGVAVYQRIDNIGPWNVRAILTSPDNNEYGRFGSLLAMDGNQLVVSDMDANWRPIHYVFQGSGANWSLTHRLSVSDVNAYFFTMDLGISNGVVAAGEPQADGAIPQSGAVYLFDLGVQAPQPIVDSDGDGMPDDWEISHGLNPAYPGDANNDNDYDMLSNLEEYQHGTDPNNPDSDGDGLFDGEEVLYTQTNPTLPDTDGDGMPDGWEVMNGTNAIINDAGVDLDNDGLSNLQEYQHNTRPHDPDTDFDGLLDGYEVTRGYNPTSPDSDNDGMTDGWEDQYGLNPLSAADANLDNDNDGLTNLQEASANSNPTNPDTDGDTLNDADEVNVYHTYPWAPDSDYDGLTDAQEVLSYRTDPLNVDSDADTLSDYDEVMTYLTNPLSSDSDADGMPDSWEVQYQLNPNDPSDAGVDLDGDGFTNLAEFEFIDRTNPRDASHYPHGPGTTKWKLSLSAAGSTTAAVAPTLGRDGTIYVSMYDRNENNTKLHAVDASGALKWTTVLSNSISTSTAVSIGHDDTLYLSANRQLYAVNPDGTIKWSFALPSHSYTTPAIGDDGTVYIGTYGISWQSVSPQVYAINPDGSLRWSYTTTGSLRFAGAISRSGRIYFTANDGSFYSFNADGTLNWRQQLQYNLVLRSPAVLADDSVLVQYNYNYSYIVQPDGSYARLGNRSYSSSTASAAIGLDTGIYTSYSRNLFKLRPDGTEIWMADSYSVAGSFRTSPTLGKNGQIYLGTYNNELLAYQPDGQLKWVYAMSQRITESPLLDHAGTLYVLDYEGTLYAVHTESGGLDSGAWPMENHDSLRTGNANYGMPKLLNGVLDTVTSAAWTVVTLDNQYRSPVIVATPAYDRSSPPTVVRIRNARDNQFEIKLQRVDGNNSETTARVHYIVLEEGVYSEDVHGVKLEAKKYLATRTDRSGSWSGEQQAYRNAYQTPIVLGQVMSTNDNRFCVFWSRGNKSSNPADTEKLYTGRHVGEDPDRTRAEETVGFVVIEAGSGRLGRYDYLAGQGADSIRGVDNGANTYNISGLSAPVSAIVAQAAMDGGDGGWAILYGANALTPDSLSLGIDEDQLKDNERSHTTEQVNYFVLQPVL